MAEFPQLPVFHVVGFTGHRQLRDPAAVERVMHDVLTGLRAEEGVEWLALSSIAEGADMVFARLALRLGLGWEAVLPLPPAEFRADFSPGPWRDVETLLGEAEHARVIGERTAREDAYLDCGMDTVNHCDVLLAVWDGEPSRGRGGTAGAEDPGQRHADEHGLPGHATVAAGALGDGAVGLGRAAAAKPQVSVVGLRD